MPDEEPQQPADTTARQPDLEGQATTTAAAAAAGDEDNAARPTQLRYGLFKAQTRFDPVAIVFTILIFIGGIIGYVTKSSSASLIAGTIFTFLLAAAVYIEGVRKNPYPLLVVLVALGAMMGYRFSESGNFMPSGLVAALTLIMVARHCYLIYLRRQPIQAP